MKCVSVLFALTSPVRGGVEEVVLALARGLDPREFRLALAAPGPLLDAFAADLADVAIETQAVEAESWRRRDEIGKLSPRRSRAGTGLASSRHITAARVGDAASSAAASSPIVWFRASWIA
jgi:hypothetical protein